MPRFISSTDPTEIENAEKYVLEKENIGVEYKGYQIIAICEYFNINHVDPFLSGRVVLKVSDEFYNQEIKDKFPLHIVQFTETETSYEGNAYIYGPEFKEGYVWVGDHMNDAANTSVFNITKGLLTKEKVDELSFMVENMYDHIENIKKIQKVIPEVLYIGSTLNGDVGASVYIHTNKKGELDGIVISSFDVLD